MVSFNQPPVSFYILYFYIYNPKWATVFNDDKLQTNHGFLFTGDQICRHSKVENYQILRLKNMIWLNSSDGSIWSITEHCEKRIFINICPYQREQRKHQHLREHSTQDTINRFACYHYYYFNLFNFGLSYINKKHG